jgi:8-oxo-dGTP pyrophosphatase MutT (NUDIX family)
MAQGVRELMNTDIGLSDTGIAGPSGATAEKPVGLFYIGLSSKKGTWSQRYVFPGSRVENKQSAAETALNILKAYLEELSDSKRGDFLEQRHVVTCFLEHRGEISLLRRSEKVGTYKGRWAGVSGYVEEGNTPYSQALQEIREEAKLGEEDIALIKEGQPLEVIDEKLSRKWIVHPFRFRVIKPEKIEIDWEHTELKWIAPQDITQYETVPKLPQTWERVA